MTKEEKIKEVYGSRYHKLKESIDCNGWINQNVTTRALFDSLEFNDKENLMRPLELRGIKNNNHWTKIESESDLPKEEIEYFVKRKNVSGTFIRQFVISHTKYWIKCYTHYQPITTPQPPIY